VIRPAKETSVRIDFVSDVACPWCTVGLASLERALARIGDALDVDVHFQPFELNPTMPPDGADAVQYLSRKYGIDAQQIARNQAAIRARGAAVGFAFGERKRVWNTFDAHRMLYWAGTEGPPGSQFVLKRALLRAYHGEGRNPGAHDVLIDLVAQAGLNTGRAGEILASDAFTGEVRDAERFWQQAGIHAVPSIVIDRAQLIQGAQPPEVLEEALRRIGAEA
jgi:predicted DsbA family dithiol-disulfide isomerase